MFRWRMALKICLQNDLPLEVCILTWKIINPRLEFLLMIFIVPCGSYPLPPITRRLHHPRPVLEESRLSTLSQSKHQEIHKDSGVYRPCDSKDYVFLDGLKTQLVS